MRRSKLINLISAGCVISIVVVTGITIWFENMIDFVPKYPSHPIISVIAMLYVVILLLIGFVKLMDKITDVFEFMKLKG